MKLSPRLVNVLLSFVSLALSVVAAEIGLRYTVSPCSEMMMERGLELHDRYFVPDPVLALRRRADTDFYFRMEERKSGFVHFVTNNQALRRTGNTTFDKPTGTKRVLALGDSHVDGVVDNEENLTSLLEARLNRENQKAGSHWEVLNGAVGSYSPYQNYLWYREAGKRFAPDLVLFTFYLGNDLAELATEDRPRLVERDGTFIETVPSGRSVVQKQGLLTRLDRVATRDSYLYSHSKSVAQRLVAQMRSGSGPGQPTVDPFGCVAQSLGQVSWTKSHHDYSQNLAAFGEILKRMRAEVESGGGQVWLVLLPTRLHVEPELDQDRISRVSKVLRLKAVDLEFENRLARDLIDLGNALGIVVLDLGPAFRTAHQRNLKPLYYQTDWHINSFGHQVAANTIYTELQRSGSVSFTRRPAPAR